MFLFGGISQDAVCLSHNGSGAVTRWAAHAASYIGNRLEGRNTLTNRVILSKL